MGVVQSNLALGAALVVATLVVAGGECRGQEGGDPWRLSGAMTTRPGRAPGRVAFDCAALFPHAGASRTAPTVHRLRRLARARDGDPLVDVMVVYTRASRDAVGGEEAMRAIIDSHVTYTNAAYARSDVNHRYRLVHVSEVDYVESGNSITDLQRLRDPDDGFMDEVHPLRDAWGADLVSLVNNSGSAGVAFMMQELSVEFAESAFSAIAPNVGGLVFAHETGNKIKFAGILPKLKESHLLGNLSVNHSKIL